MNKVTLMKSAHIRANSGNCSGFNCDYKGKLSFALRMAHRVPRVNTKLVESL